MWSLTLAALAALAVAVFCRCPGSTVYEPLNKTMKRLEYDASAWLDMDSACNRQFHGGFEMLRRDFMHVPEEYRISCPWVPLGLEKDGLGPIVWRKGYFGCEEEEVNSTYLARMEGDVERSETSDYRVGGLDVTTNQWRLVDKILTYRCTICQRAWVSRLDYFGEYPRTRAKPFESAFTFRILKTGDDEVSVDEAIRRIEERLKERLGIQVEIEKLASYPGGHNGASLRMKSPFWRLKPFWVTWTLKGSYRIESWWDMDFCPATHLDGIDWEEKREGHVGIAKLPAFHYATKRCVARLRSDGDWDAVWEDDVSYWIDRTGECKAQAADKLEN